MHKLLAKQLTNATDAAGKVDVKNLAELVSAAYEDLDRDRHRTDRSIELMIAEIEASQKRLLDALDVVPEGFALFDAQDRYVLWNHQYMEMYPESRDLFSVGKRFEDVLRDGMARGQYPEAEGREDEWIAERLARHIQPHSTHEQHLTNGRWVRVEERRTAEGGSIGVRVDITELKNREASFRLLFDSNPIPMWVFEHGSLRFLAVNDAAVAHYGYSREQFLSMTLLDLRPQQDKEEFKQALKTPAGDLPQGRARRHIKADGTRIDVAIYAQELEYEGHNARLVAVTDITAQKQAENELLRAREFLNTIIENVPAAIFVKDLQEFRYVLANRGGEEFLGRSRDQIIGKTAYEIFSKPEADAIAARDRLLLERGRQQFFDDHPIHTPGKGDRYVATRRLIVRSPDGQPQYLLSVIEDITERRQAENELRRTREFLRTIIENVPAAIYVKELSEFRHILVNRAGEQFFGRPREEIIGKTLHDIFPWNAAETILARDMQALQSNQNHIYDENPILLTVSGWEKISVRRIVVRDTDNIPQYLLTVIENLTVQRQAEERAAHLAQYDALTDLPNRAAFNKNFESTLKRSATANESFALMSIDLDRFKEINDVFGHAVGDALLCQVSRRLQEAAGDAIIARLGGDEFAVIAANSFRPEAAAVLAEELLSVMAEEFVIEGQHIHASLSIGVAVYPNDGIDGATLLGNADAALYRAKADGRGTVRFFQADMDKRLREQRALQHDLGSAIERSELVLHFQPQATIGGDVIGFEALVRWNHPSRGLVPPGMFIPIAEESGLILPIGEWVLREACREAASWPKPLQIAINLSPVQFRHGDLPALIHSILLETGLQPDRLELEITESVLIDNFSKGTSILRRLKSLGVRIAMDDFGTGYSSLSYLQSFPFDKIKIDQAFISNVERNAQSATIVRAVIGLAKGLGLPVLAEGVETKEQLAFLTQEACNQVQGYLIGRPYPIEQYLELIGRPAAADRKSLVA